MIWCTFLSLSGAVSAGRARTPCPAVKAVDEGSPDLESEKFVEDIKEKVNLTF